MKRVKMFRGLAAGMVVLVAALNAYGQATDSRNFPRQLLINGAQVVIHAPQVESWEGYEALVSWHAVEVNFLAENVAHVGAVKLRALTQVDKSAREVHVYQVEVLEMHFPGVPKGQAELISSAGKFAIESERGTFPLDLVLANLARHGNDAEAMPPVAHPPAIYAAESPTVLVLIDGDPVLAPIDGTALHYVVNSDWDLFVDEKPGTHFLLHDGMWLEAAQIQGPWQNAAVLPTDFAALPAAPRWDAARNAAAPVAGAAPAPKILVSTRPAELILTQGAPLFREFPDTFLAYVDNTDSDVFMELTTATYYFLVSGRWFKAQAMDGPWEQAGELPEDFARIPYDGPRGDVLASVPGTWAARLAAMEAGIPQKATVDPSQASPKVSYSGAPKFEPIPGTSVARAVNTGNQVLQVQASYFACYQGVWFLASAATGPWAVAREVPEAIYAIPPTSPAYPVTFVRAYGNKGGKATFGYTAGYENVYISGGMAVYGTGHDYPPYIDADASPPVYYPGFSAFGAAAYYDSYDSVFRQGARGGQGPQNAYLAWGSMVAVPEYEQEGHTERLAAPSAASVQANAASDLYVGPDRHVYARRDDSWNRVSAAEGGPADREQAIEDDQERIEAGLQGEGTVPLRDRQLALDQSLQDEPLPPSGLVIDGEYEARQYYYDSQLRLRRGNVRRRAGRP